MPTVYLLHFDQPISDNSTTQHYIGWATDLDRRIEQHRKGISKARLTQVAYEKGIGFQVVRLWDGERTLERKLKNRKQAKNLCPICNPESYNKNGNY